MKKSFFTPEPAEKAPDKKVEPKAKAGEPEVEEQAVVSVIANDASRGTSGAFTPTDAARGTSGTR
jgi:hypothetical protein